MFTSSCYKGSAPAALGVREGFEQTSSAYVLGSALSTQYFLRSAVPTQGNEVDRELGNGGGTKHCVFKTFMRVFKVSIVFS